MGKGFGEIFSESWKEFRNNFSIFFKVFLILYLVPQVILLIFKDFFPDRVLGLVFVLSIIAAVLTFIAYLCFIYISFFNQGKRMEFGKTFNGALKYFWSYLGLTLLTGILLVLLFIALIIPGIIFMIYWGLAAYVLIAEGKGPWESMKESKRLVRGKWWRTFGYFILLMLIILLISFAFSIPSVIFTFIALGQAFLTLSTTTTLPAGFLVLDFVGDIISVFSTLITGPLIILFFKNLYLDYKKGKK